MVECLTRVPSRWRVTSPASGWKSDGGGLRPVAARVFPALEGGVAPPEAETGWGRRGTLRVPVYLPLEGKGNQAFVVRGLPPSVLGAPLRVHLPLEGKEEW